MKSALWLAMALMLPASAMAGKKDKEPKVDPDHANYYKPVAPVGDDITVGVEDAWSRLEEVKLKMRVLNGTRDWVVYVADETRFDFGSGEIEPKRGRFAAIKPKSASARVLSGVGTGMHTDTFHLLARGVYRVPEASLKSLSVADMQLPLATSSFEAGPFSCDIPGKVKQETDETKLKMVCSYQGDGGGIGLVDPTKIQVRLEDGQLFANDDRKTDALLAVDGDDFKFDIVFHVSAKITDMQFANMHVVFNDTFQTGELVPVEFEPIALDLDPALTTAKN